MIRDLPETTLLPCFLNLTYLNGPIGTSACSGVFMHLKSYVQIPSLRYLCYCHEKQHTDLCYCHEQQHTMS